MDFRTLTLQLPIQTQNSLAPELQVFVLAKRAHPVLHTNAFGCPCRLLYLENTWQEAEIERYINMFIGNYSNSVAFWLDGTTNISKSSKNNDLSENLVPRTGPTASEWDSEWNTISLLERRIVIIVQGK